MSRAFCADRRKEREKRPDPGDEKKAARADGATMKRSWWERNPLKAPLCKRLSPILQAPLSSSRVADAMRRLRGVVIKIKTETSKNKHILPDAKVIHTPGIDSLGDARLVLQNELRVARNSRRKVCEHQPAPEKHRARHRARKRMKVHRSDGRAVRSHAKLF